ncbi:MAG: hypothetical protein AB7O91_09080 [Sphingomonas sp.]
MVRAASFCVLLALAAAPAFAQRQSLGVFGGWAAFRDPGRCYAIAAPVAGPRPEGWRPFLSVGHWPARGPGGQVHVRLSRAKRDGSAVLLRIDGTSFQLVGSGRDAWAPDSGADDAILAAMRTGLNLVVETRAANGARFREGYQLRGAATAIDAAALACRPR